jgi:hypothetical protein
VRGDFYLLGHRDPAPALAMVDARRGRILATLPPESIPSVPGYVWPGGDFTRSITDADATILPDGRIRAVVRSLAYRQSLPAEAGPRRGLEPFSAWLTWTQSEAPRLRFQAETSAATAPFALSRDGSRLLVTRGLQPDILVSSCRPYRCPPSPPPTPVTGMLAELLDAESGRMLWTLSATATGSWVQDRAPASSPDNRYALLQLPSDGELRRIGLISMADARVLQTFWSSHASTLPEGFGFTVDGRKVWTSGGGELRLYRFDRS